jgi:hypothetical protein
MGISVTAEHKQRMKLHFEIQRVMIGAAGVKSGLALWAGIAASQILVNT